MDPKFNPYIGLIHFATNIHSASAEFLSGHVANTSIEHKYSTHVFIMLDWSNVCVNVLKLASDATTANGCV